MAAPFRPQVLRCYECLTPVPEGKAGGTPGSSERMVPVRQCRFWLERAPGQAPVPCDEDGLPLRVRRRARRLAGAALGRPMCAAVGVGPVLCTACTRLTHRHPSAKGASVPDPTSCSCT